MERSSERLLARDPRRRTFGNPRSFFRNVLRRENEIHATRRNGAARHQVVARRFVLGEGNPALGLDRIQSERTRRSPCRTKLLRSRGLILDMRAYPRHQEYDLARKPTLGFHSPDCELFRGVLSVMYITDWVGELTLL